MQTFYAELIMELSTTYDYLYHIEQEMAEDLTAQCIPIRFPMR